MGTETERRLLIAELECYGTDADRALLELACSQSAPSTAGVRAAEHGREGYFSLLGSAVYEDHTSYAKLVREMSDLLDSLPPGCSIQTHDLKIINREVLSAWALIERLRRPVLDA